MQPESVNNINEKKEYKKLPKDFLMAIYSP